MDKELLYRFFSGETTVGEERKVLDWLDEDPVNYKEMLAERKLFDSMIMLGETERMRPRRRILALPGWVRQTVRYAAVVLVAAGLSGVYISRLYDRLLLAGNTITVPAGQRVDVVLPDGTKVCMNALSKLEYPTFFAHKQRRVRLTGEAFFEVAHDSRHPFVVETYACDVEALGTKFDVEAHPEQDEFTASLVEGRVRVSDKNNPDSRVEIGPNQQVNRLDERLVVGKIPENEGFLWREGLIAFRDASFPELIREFEKYFGVKIEMRRKEVACKSMTGKIRISEGVDHALWVLQQSADFRFTRNEKRDVIYIQ